MEPNPLAAELEERYKLLRRRKEAALKSHCCSACGTQWSASGSYFCLECGAAYGACCIKQLNRTAHAAQFLLDGEITSLMYRCGCGGWVG